VVWVTVLVLVTVVEGPATVETDVIVVEGPGTVETTVEVGPGTVDVTVTVGVVVVEVLTTGVGGPWKVNEAKPTRIWVLDWVQDADTEYVPGTHSQ